MDYAEQRSYECADSHRPPRIAPDPVIGGRRRGTGALGAVLNDAICGGQGNIPGGADLGNLGIRDGYDVPDQAIDAVRKLSVLVGATVPAKQIGRRPTVDIGPHARIVGGGGFVGLQANGPTGGQSPLTKPATPWARTA